MLRIAVAAGLIAMILVGVAACASVTQFVIFMQQGALAPSQAILVVAKTVLLIVAALADAAWLVAMVRQSRANGAAAVLWLGNVIAIWFGWIVNLQLTIYPSLPWYAGMVTIAAAIAFAMSPRV